MLGAELILDSPRPHPYCSSGPKASATVRVCSRSAYRAVKIWAAQMGYVFSRPGRSARRDAATLRYLTGNAGGIITLIRVWDGWMVYERKGSF